MSRYSQLYIERGKPGQDSERFRWRIGATFSHVWTAPGLDAALLPIIAAIELNTGRKVPQSQSIRTSVARFIEAVSMPDVLDTVTLVLRVVENPNRHSVSAAAWLQQAEF